MLAYMARRLMVFPLILLGISIIAFIVGDALPGDVMDVMINPTLGAEQIQLRRQQLGLDQPLYVQYFRWLGQLVRGDLGYSMATREPVGAVIAGRVVDTMLLMVASLVLSLLIAIPAGVISALKPRSLSDYVVTLGSFAGLCTPTFFLGLLFIYAFSLSLGWLPSGGTRSFGVAGGTFVDRMQHLIMPAMVLGAFSAAEFTRYIRSSMIEALHQQYITTARAKGLSQRRVTLLHAGRNVLIPIITLLGMRIPMLFSGAVLAETVFSWPGMGRLLVNAVFERDSAVLVGMILFIGVLVMVGNLLADLLYAVVDPRVRYG